MGYMTDGLTFNTLRSANLRRLPEFQNAQGLPAHSRPDGSDWSPAQWLQALIVELGKFANARQQFERGDIDLNEYFTLAWQELADVQTYLDLLAARALDVPRHPHHTGIDLGKATIAKWNMVSARVNSRLRIRDDGSDWYLETAIMREGAE